MIKYILLGFLNYNQMTGYDLKQAIDSSTAHFWHAHHSQIYTTLREMEKDGLVTSQYIQEAGQPDRRVYTISESGKQDLINWLNQPMTEPSPIKEAFLVRLFFSGQRDPQKVIAELLVQRELHQRQMAVYKSILHPIIEQNAQIAPCMEREAAFWHATLEMGIHYEEMYLDWISQTIEKIEML
jgi:PadR family transcriptional regulator, regulatory protein AphA